MTRSFLSIGPHPLPGPVVHDPLATSRVRRERRCVWAAGGHERQRIAEEIDGTGSRRRRVDDQRCFVGPDVERQCGLATDHAVDEQVLVLLQLVDSAERGVVVRAAGRAAEVALGDQRLLQAGDRRARVADTQLALVELAAAIGGWLARRRSGLARRSGWLQPGRQWWRWRRYWWRRARRQTRDRRRRTGVRRLRVRVTQLSPATACP